LTSLDTHLSLTPLTPPFFQPNYPYGMDRREILSKGAALQKAISAREPTSTIINILNDLKVNVKPTEELLRATGIGKVVNKVKGINTVDPSVQQLASEIISRWRHVVNEQKMANSGAGTPTPNGARSNGTSSPGPPAKPAPKPSSSGIDPTKRNWKVDKAPRDEATSDTSRNNCVGLLYDGLCLGSTQPMTEIFDIAKAIEAAVLALPDANNSPAAPAYKEKIRSLFQNLKNKSNPKLRTRILSGEISPKRFANMSPDEMKSQEQRDEDARMQKENLNNAMTPQEAQSVSSSIECPKCHKKSVTYTQAQTRSADEPMTNFCECQNCSYRWKFS
jgi:transcription elongation factor S-II